VTTVEFKGKTGKFTKIAPYERLKLKWALEGDEFAPVSIAKDAPAHFGIVHAHEKIRHFEIPTQVRSHSHPPEFSKHGTYRVTVVVTSPNCTSATKAILIDWNGEWFNIEARLNGARKTPKPRKSSNETRADR
jgi:hypothetical protein